MLYPVLFLLTVDPLKLMGNANLDLLNAVGLL